MTEFAINGYSLIFVLWNLFLAIIPCYLAWHFEKSTRNKKFGQMSGFQKIAYAPILFFWLFFLPNTAYLITMVRHLLDHCADYDKYRVCVEQGWMVPFFFGYAMLGIPTFYYALKKMTSALKKLISPKMDPLFPIIMLPVTAFGILLGLFPRLNSWQIVTDPLAILGVSFDYLTDPVMLLNFLAYTIVLAMIYYGMDYRFRLKD